jgi:nitrous oxidase accessory protein NosD
VGCLRSGTYAPNPGDPYVLDIHSGGFRLRAAPRERALLAGDVVIWNSAPSVSLSHLDIEGDGHGNTVKVYANDVTIEDSVITNRNRGRSCMILGSNAGWGEALRAVVRRNTFHDCGSPANGDLDHAIYAQAVEDGRIVGNVFWGSAAYAIQLYPNAQRTLVAHNVIDGSSPSVRGGIVFGGDDSFASNNNTVAFNVISDAVAHGLSASWRGAIGSGNVAKDNCLWRPGGGIGESRGFASSANVLASPLFRDADRHDYRLGSASRCLQVVGYDAAARLRLLPLALPRP